MGIGRGIIWLAGRDGVEISDVSQCVLAVRLVPMMILVYLVYKGVSW
jgi:hypothetical protein